MLCNAVFETEKHTHKAKCDKSSKISEFQSHIRKKSKMGFKVLVPDKIESKGRFF